MRITTDGSCRIGAPREAVWRLLMDPVYVCRSAPNVQRVEPLSPTHYRVHAGVGLGPLRATFVLEIRLEGLEPPDAARLRAHGRAPGSEVEVRSALRLEAADGEATRLSWRMESDLTGAMALAGPTLATTAARTLTREFWRDFARRAEADLAR